MHDNLILVDIYTYIIESDLLTIIQLGLINIH